MWAITLNKPLSLTIVCNSKDRKSHIIHPYVQVLRLQPNCHAYSGELILPAHFQGHSESRIIDKYAPLITVFNQSITPEIWRPLVQNNDDFRIHIPKHLENLQKIPMQHLISTLKDTDLNNILDRWTWQDYMLLSLGIILALIILYGILKKLNIPGKLFEKCKKACMSKSTKNDELSHEEISDQRTSKLSNTRTP